MTTEQKARAYDEVVNKLRHFIVQGVDPLITRTNVQDFFPELKESEGEKIRNISKNIEGSKVMLNACINALRTIGHSHLADWLEKQGTERKQLYIRFGDIPSNEKSKIYRGEEEIGIEEGISVYPAFEDKEGNIILGLNLPITKTSLRTQQHLLEYDNRPCYLVTGDYVSKGADGEPLIKNVKIIKEIKEYRMKQDKENNTYVINNTPNCGISVYNEELKESEDKEHRKWILEYLYDGLRKSDEQFKGQFKCAIAWLEKERMGGKL